MSCGSGLHTYLVSYILTYVHLFCMVPVTEHQIALMSKLKTMG